MKTVYDWVTLALFCLLALVFLQRSAGPPMAGDSAIRYLPPALGCMAVNALGNARDDLAAIAVLAVTAGYMAVVLKPWRMPR